MTLWFHRKVCNLQSTFDTSNPLLNVSISHLMSRIPAPAPQRPSAKRTELKMSQTVMIPSPTLVKMCIFFTRDIVLFLHMQLLCIWASTPESS